ncbi:NAD-binding protein [Neobacillus rhizosphaerae]|uniref:NAD-binding protein n=1 Tax=Neobacillus rhizosphaerae TaxID=2880965 RepID=UPI003D266021
MKRNKKLLLAFSCLTILGLIPCYYPLFNSYINKLVTLVFLLSGIVGLGNILLGILKPTFKNKSQIILFLMSIICGFIGYSIALEPNNYLNILYYTAKLFTISVEPIGSPKNQIGYQYSLWIELARWSAVLFITSAVLSKLYNVTSDSFGRIKIVIYRMLLNKRHVVISGINEASVLLAKDLRRKEELVVIITSQVDHPQIPSLRENGVTFVFGEALETSVLKKANVLESSHLILMDHNEAKNIDVFMKVKSLIKQENKIKKHKVNCFLHIKDDTFHSIFEEIENEIIELDVLRQSLDFHLFNLNKLKAKILFEDHPLYESGKVNIKSKNENDVAHLLIVGFGNTGQQVLLQAARLGHFINRQKLHVTIVDKNGEARRSSFLRRYKFIEKVCKINFITMDIDSEEFKKEMFEVNEKEITYIVICLESDHLDFISSMFLHEEYKDIPILLEVRDDIKLANWIHINSKKFQNLYCFGDLREIVSKEVIIDEKLDNLAKAINDFYCQENSNGFEWDQLTTFLKDSNRSQADHINTKLRTLGLEMKEKSQVLGDDLILNETKYLQICRPYLEDLAIAEHNRWCAFHYLKGWNTKMTDLSVGSHRDEHNKLHAGLVEWERLVELSSADKDYQDNNRDTIRNIYKILDNNGYVICAKE